MDLPEDKLDTRMMRRCIELSRQATAEGEFPFAAMICKNDATIAEATNRVGRDSDVTRHAELLAISEAQRTLGSKRLDGCTLYSTVEPCPMCSFPIRETRIARVVCAIRSPLMGGVSKWPVLLDDGLSSIMPERFAPAPEIVIGLLNEEAEEVWRDWNPLIWAIIRKRGCFGDDGDKHSLHVAAAPRRWHIFDRLLALFA